MATTMEQMFPRQTARLRAEGQVKVLLGIARERFGKTPRALKKRLHAASPEDLDSWQVRLLRAPSIDEAMNGNGSWANGATVSGNPEAAGLHPLARFGHLARRLWKKR